MGFNGPDSGILSYQARWLLSGRHLSGKQAERHRTGNQPRGRLGCPRVMRVLDEAHDRGARRNDG